MRKGFLCEGKPTAELKIVSPCLSPHFHSPAAGCVQVLHLPPDPVHDFSALCFCHVCLQLTDLSHCYGYPTQCFDLCPLYGSCSHCMHYLARSHLCLSSFCAAVWWVLHCTGLTSSVAALDQVPQPLPLWTRGRRHGRVCMFALPYTSTAYVHTCTCTCTHVQALSINEIAGKLYYSNSTNTTDMLW